MSRNKNSNPFCGISRREAIRRAIIAAGGLIFADGLSFRALASPPTGRAKAVIQLWLWGGPPHLDTFDPKPEAGYDYCGPFKTPVETNVPGIRICELLPLLAKQADKYSILRSMTHGNNGHETAAYIVQTGRMPGGRMVYPCIGAVMSLFKGYDAGYKGFDSALHRHDRPAGTIFAERIFERALPAVRHRRQSGADAVRRGRHRRAGHQRTAPARPPRIAASIEHAGHAMPEDAQLAASNQAEQQAYDMILGDGAKVFDLSQENSGLRDRYGRTKFGQSCLAARRLVEHGVPFVTINSPGWDTHKENFQAMRRLLPDLDKGMSALLQDLSDRGLLDSGG